MKATQMLVSLYSGFISWIVVPQRVKPTNAAAMHGPLIFEGTIHSHLMARETWSHIWSEWEKKAFATVSEDLGLVLLEAGLIHSGTLTPPHAVPWRFPAFERTST
jgi:hypothetical protein